MDLEKCDGKAIAGILLQCHTDHLTPAVIIATEECLWSSWLSRVFMVSTLLHILVPSILSSAALWTRPLLSSIALWACQVQHYALRCMHAPTFLLCGNKIRRVSGWLHWGNLSQIKVYTMVNPCIVLMKTNLAKQLHTSTIALLLHKFFCFWLYTAPSTNLKSIWAVELHQLQLLSSAKFCHLYT